MSLLPATVNLTPIRKKLLKQLADGRWHRKFPGIGTKTFDLMSIMGFIKVRYIDRKRWETTNGKVEARITIKGRFLLRNKSATMRYGKRVTIQEMER